MRFARYRHPPPHADLARHSQSILDALPQCSLLFGLHRAASPLSWVHSHLHRTHPSHQATPPASSCLLYTEVTLPSRGSHEDSILGLWLPMPSG